MALAFEVRRVLGTVVDRPVSSFERAARSALRTCRCLAFWLGVVLPLSYVPLLLLVDVGVVEDFDLVVHLAAVNGLAFVAGHEHEPSGRRRRDAE